MSTPAHHHPTHHTHAPRLPRVYPPRSLLGVGVLARLSVAALASGLLWLSVLWALD